jgi:integrase
VVAVSLDKQVAASTQNQALNAVVFLYRKVIKKDMGDLSAFRRARRGLRLPVVASRAEVKAVIERLQGRERLIACLLYGTGMRIEECLGMRVQDIHFDQNRIVAHGKGDKDRYVPLPEGTLQLLRQYWSTHRHPVWLFPAPTRAGVSMTVLVNRKQTLLIIENVPTCMGTPEL